VAVLGTIEGLADGLSAVGIAVGRWSSEAQLTEAARPPGSTW
jgi:hypothetical protein